MMSETESTTTALYCAVSDLECTVRDLKCIFIVLICTIHLVYTGAYSKMKQYIELLYFCVQLDG